MANLPAHPDATPVLGTNWVLAESRREATGRPTHCPVLALDATDQPGDHIDVCGRDRAELDRLVAAIEANPHAATVLVGLLRHNERVAVPGRLLAESLAYSTLQHGSEFRRWLGAQEPRSSLPDRHPPLLLDRDGDEVQITLNRPERRNAYSAGLRDALCDALELVLVDTSIRRAVVRGAGPCFSAGGDLTEFGSAADAAEAHLVRTARSAGALIHALGERIEFRVHGSCVGAGIELPAFAGRVTASADATFRLPEVAMGLIPGAGGTASILGRIGRQRLARMALLNEAVDASTARSWGLVDAIEAP